MKLSDICKKLGLDPAKTGEKELFDALDAAVTRANEGAAVLTILKGWTGKVVAVADVTSLCNAAVVHPQSVLADGGQCTAEKDLIAKLQAQIATPLPNEALTKANERATAAEGKVVAAEKRATDAVAALTLANSKVTAAETKVTATEQTLANVKTAIAKKVVSLALANNKVLKNEAATKEAELANSADFVVMASSILDAQPKLNSNTRVDASNRAKIVSDPNSATMQFQTLVNEEMAKDKRVDRQAAYTAAHLKVKKSRQDLVQQMTNEAAPEKTAANAKK